MSKRSRAAAEPQPNGGTVDVEQFKEDGDRLSAETADVMDDALAIPSDADAPPKKERTRPSLPPEMRAKYLVIGFNPERPDKVLLGEHKSLRRARNWCLSVSALLALNFKCIEIIRAKRIEMYPGV